MLQTAKVVSIQTHSNQTGKPITVKSTNGEEVAKVIVNVEGGLQVWAPANVPMIGATHVTFDLQKKGETFVATRDSSREDKDGNPLYEKGEEVRRGYSKDAKGEWTVPVEGWKESTVFTSFLNEGKPIVAEQFTDAMKEKMKFAAELGLQVRI